MAIPFGWNPPPGIPRHIHGAVYLVDGPGAGALTVALEVGHNVVVLGQEVGVQGQGEGGQLDLPLKRDREGGRGPHLSLWLSLCGAKKTNAQYKNIPSRKYPIHKI